MTMEAIGLNIAHWIPVFLKYFHDGLPIELVVFHGVLHHPGLVSLKSHGLSSSFRILAASGTSGLVIVLAPLVGWITDQQVWWLQCGSPVETEIAKLGFT